MIQQEMLNPITWFFRTFSQSATEPAYYLYILRTPFWAALRFFLVSIFLLSCADLIIIRAREVPRFAADLEVQAIAAADSLPDGFTSKWENGQLKLHGIKLPHTIPSTPALRSWGIPDSLLTISASASAEPNSFLTLTSEKLIVSGNELSSNLQAFSLSDILGSQTSQWDKQALLSQANRLSDSLKRTAGWVLILSLPFWFLGLSLITFVMLVFLSLLSNSISWILGVRLPYFKTLQMGLHAITVATALDVAKFALYPQTEISLVIPAYLGIMLLATWTIRSNIAVK